MLVIDSFVTGDILVSGGISMDNRPLSNIGEAATDLHCCKATLYRAVKAGLIPAVRIGRSIRLEPETIQNIRKNGLPRLTEAR